MGQMFCYIDQLRTPSFPIALIKTQSDFIVRTVETGSGRLTLVAAVINADAYPFLGFLRPDLSPCGYRNRCFLVALCRLAVRRKDMEVATERLLRQHVKILGQFQCYVTHEIVSLKLFPVVWIFPMSLFVMCYNR